MSLPRSQRLRRSRDFQRVFQEGRYWRGTYATLLIRWRPDGGLRIGWSIRRTLGRGVVRNRVRRRLSEAFRRVRVHLQGHADLVVIPTSAAGEANWEDLLADLLRIFRRAGLQREGRG